MISTERRTVPSSATALLAAALLGCSSAQGPAPSPPTALSEGQARLFIYHRAEARTTYDYGEIVSVDGTDIATLSIGFGSGCSYTWVDVAPGRHEVVARSKSHWFNLGSIPANPIRVEVPAEAGETYFVHLTTSGGTAYSLSVSVGTHGGVHGSTESHSVPVGKQLIYGQSLQDSPVRDCELAAS